VLKPATPTSKANQGDVYGTLFHDLFPRKRRYATSNKESVEKLNEADRVPDKLSVGKMVGLLVVVGGTEMP
jgi:hypothetical protein